MDDCILGAYDAKARLAFLDQAGIWAQVLYPNVAGFGRRVFRELEDREPSSPSCAPTTTSSMSGRPLMRRA